MDLGTIEIPELRTLRLALLAPAGGPYDADYDGDLAEDTGHRAIRDAGGVVGIATVLREPCPLDPGADDWRIRGLAVAPQARRQGHAARLIDACVTHAEAHGARRVWAWARPTSQARFVAAGFAVAPGRGRSFGDLGPHELLILRTRLSG